MTLAVRKRRIAISVWGIGGGAFANVAALLARGFVALGVDVDVLYLHADQRPDRVGMPKTVTLIPLNSSRSLRSVVPLARYLKDRNPSGLVSIGWMQNSPAVLAKILSRWQGVLVLSEHLSMRQLGSEKSRRRFIYRFLPAICRHLYPRADALVVVSDEVLHSMIQEVGISPTMLPMRVIANAVDLDDVRNRGEETVQHPWIQNKRLPIIVSVGKLTKRKNHRLLVEAFVRVRDHVDARLVIVGEGPERASLGATIKALALADVVSIPGFAFNPVPYLLSADVFALPSKAEGWPLALMEAMAVGCPVVATSVGGIPQLLDHGKAGILVGEGDVRALSESLARILTDDRYREELGAAGLLRVSQFTPKRVAGEWLAFMDEARAEGGE